METSADTPKIDTWITLHTSKFNQPKEWCDQQSPDKTSYQLECFRAERRWSAFINVALRGSNHILYCLEKCHILLINRFHHIWTFLLKRCFLILCNAFSVDLYTCFHFFPPQHQRWKIMSCLELHNKLDQQHGLWNVWGNRIKKKKEKKNWEIQTGSTYVVLLRPIKTIEVLTGTVK